MTTRAAIPLSVAPVFVAAGARAASTHAVVLPATAAAGLQSVFEKKATRTAAQQKPAPYNDDVMSLPLARYRFTVDEYYRLAQVGILGEDERVELIDGEIVRMTPIGSRHAASVSRIDDLLHRLLQGRAVIRAQSPVRLDEHNEPEPDLCVARPRDDAYFHGHPGAADVLLLIEVADSSIGYDRTVKLPLYARSGIGAVWIVDLGGGKVEAYSEPSADGYLQRRTCRPQDRLGIPGNDAEVEAAQLLPP